MTVQSSTIIFPIPYMHSSFPYLQSLLFIARLQFPWKLMPIHLTGSFLDHSISSSLFPPFILSKSALYVVFFTILSFTLSTFPTHSFLHTPSGSSSSHLLYPDLLHSLLLPSLSATYQILTLSFLQCLQPRFNNLIIITMFCYKIRCVGFQDNYFHEQHLAHFPSMKRLNCPGGITEI